MPGTSISRWQLALALAAVAASAAWIVDATLRNPNIPFLPAVDDPEWIGVHTPTDTDAIQVDRGNVPGYTFSTRFVLDAVAPNTVVRTRSLGKLELRINGALAWKSDPGTSWKREAVASVAELLRSGDNEIRARDEILQFFGDNYGDTVRVVQIGGDAGALNGYSMELCGGTHTLATGEIGLFRILSESAIAAGVRRIEAIAGLVAAEQAQADSGRITAMAKSLNSPIAELEKKIEQAVEQSKKLEKKLNTIQQSRAAETARNLAAKAEAAGDIPFISANLGTADGNFAQAVVDALKGEFEGVVVLGATENGNVALVASVSESLTNRAQAGKIIQTIAPIVGGKGGGKPTQARGAGRENNKLDEALAEVPRILAN